MIIRKETLQKDTIRLEWIGRELSSNEKNFIEFICSWISGVMSLKNEMFTLFAIKQLGSSLDQCSNYLKSIGP